MSAEIQFIKKDLIKIDNSAIQELQEKAKCNDSGKHRYCFHENEDAQLQEMLFVIPSGWYARPHKHERAAESQVVIDGEGYFILFDESGNVTESFKISPRENFIYRIQKGIWHTVLPVSDQMVIYEIRAGKFDSSTSTFAEWAPKEDQKEEIRYYMQELLKKVGGNE